MADEVEVYRLSRPVTVKITDANGSREETIESLSLRRAIGRDLYLIDKYRGEPMRLTLELISALAGQHMVVVEKIDTDDLGPLGDLCFARLPDGRPTGEAA